MCRIKLKAKSIKQVWDLGIGVQRCAATVLPGTGSALQSIYKDLEKHPSRVREICIALHDMTL